MYYGAGKVTLDLVSREAVFRQFNEDLYIHNFLCHICLFVSGGFVLDNKELFSNRDAFCFD